MTIALIIIAIGLASVAGLAHVNREHRKAREWNEPTRLQAATIRARRPRRRPF